MSMVVHVNLSRFRRCLLRDETDGLLTRCVVLDMVLSELTHMAGNKRLPKLFFPSPIINDRQNDSDFPSIINFLIYSNFPKMTGKNDRENNDREKKASVVVRFPPYVQIKLKFENGNYSRLGVQKPI